MPLEVSEKIFGLLDFADKKSFSETCKRFNSIFSDHINLRRVWLKLYDDGLLVADNPSRAYVNFSCYLAQQQTVPTGFWERMSPTIRSLQISSLTSFITAGLPNFANLVHLDLSGNDSNFALSPPAEPVAMERLVTLRMSAHVFACLEGNFINFTTNRLQKCGFLKIWVSWSSSWIMMDFRRCETCYVVKRA